MPAEITSGVAIAALIVALLAFALVLVVGWRGRRRRRHSAIPVDATDTDIDLAVERAFARLDELAHRVDSLHGRLPVVEDQGRRAVQHVGVVRFNPFEDTGGNQSFALALLDSKSDGIVISSLHSRQATRQYLKSVAGGKTETALSDEESEALRKAIAN
jgi:hypothetical protein